MNLFTEIEVINHRNCLWKDNNSIPKWVDTDDVGLDQFFTRKDIAKKYYNYLLDFLLTKNISKEDCLFIEPSAGEGSFFNLLPKESRIGLDIMPMAPDIKRQDFLSWKAPETNKKIIFIGNPPFGYRAWLALAFMNHAAKYADYVGFILPMSFQSEGKGSPKYRVNGLKEVVTKFLPSDSFYNPSMKAVKINALWQIWERGENIVPKKKTCNDWIDLFTVDQRKERLCGQERMEEADFFLQRTYYNQQPKLVTDFSDVKYVCGYGIAIKKEKNKIIKMLNRTNWDEYSNLAAHNCRHISMYHIEKVLTDNGLIDG